MAVSFAEQPPGCHTPVPPAWLPCCVVIRNVTTKPNSCKPNVNIANALSDVVVIASRVVVVGGSAAAAALVAAAAAAAVAFGYVLPSVAWLASEQQQQQHKTKAPLLPHAHAASLNLCKFILTSSDLCTSPPPSLLHLSSPLSELITPRRRVSMAKRDEQSEAAKATADNSNGARRMLSNFQFKQ